DAAGYALQPAGDGELRGDAIVVPDTKTPGLDGTFLYSRTLTALERPDSLAAEVAYARTLGEPLGDLEVRVGDAASPSAAADLELHAGGADDRTLAARAIPACGSPRGYRVRAPAGSYTIAWKGVSLASVGPKSADVAGDRVTFVDLALGPSDEPFHAPARERRCPASDAVAELAP
ncbi:MAG TPA: hypothetical protein VL400_23450, partial [Polyangiaceae bacterium]|nr:hypothetical protein [Polyangiaceae bacterium]